MTYHELNVMMERYNEKKKNEYEMQRNVIYNAVVNANRKRGSRMIPLFKDSEKKTITEIMEEREELFGKTA